MKLAEKDVATLSFFIVLKGNSFQALLFKLIKIVFEILFIFIY